MREILFRGKRIDNGEWIAGDFISSAAYTDRAWITESKTLFDREIYEIGVREVDASTVGQYTGLTDKNGVKIFEGDIVCNDEPEDMEYKPLPVFGVVKFGEYDGDLLSLEYQTISDHVGFFVDWRDNDDGEYSKDFRRDLEYWTKYPHFEACGNIHDNPELLEAKL